MSLTDRTPATASVIQDLLERITMRVPGERAEPLLEFARAFTRRLADEGSGDLGAEELFGRVMSAFDLVDARSADPLAVRAFNPVPEVDGFHAAGTVLQTNMEDAPFLFDSVSEEIEAQQLAIRRMFHPVIGTGRNAEGGLTRVLHAHDAGQRESLMHFELDRRVDGDDLEALEAGVRRVLGDVRTAVRDFHSMKERIERMIGFARSGEPLYDPGEIEETAAFLRWLGDGNFLLLGYREYELVDTAEGRALQAALGSGLGILSDVTTSSYARPVPLARIDPELRARIEGGDLLIYAKTNRPSTVHRRARMDYVGVRRVEGGRVVGEARLLGLFTSKAYMDPAASTPLLHRKLQQILEAEDFVEGSHDYRAAVAIFESFPKDELLAAPVEELRRSVVGLLALQEQRNVRLFLRRDPFGRSVSLLVALPRDRFNAELRKRLQALFMERLHGTGVDYHLSLGEADPARIHFTVHVESGEMPHVHLPELEEEVVELCRTWDDRVLELLQGEHGEHRGRELHERWSGRLPDYYKGSNDPAKAVGDIGWFEELEAHPDWSFVVGLQNAETEHESLTRVGLYKVGGKIWLSDFVPILEALGLRVVEEVPTHLHGTPEQERVLHDFGVLGPNDEPLDLDACGQRVGECISAAWRGVAESDSLNRLVVTAGLSWRQVAILRAYRRYRARVSAGFTEEYMNEAFAANPQISAKLAGLFELRFDPARPRDEAAEKALKAQVLADLDEVTSLDEDRILRGHLGAVEATVRTSAFRPERRSISFKLRSASVPEMPKPTPLFEIFVYSPEMEGVHLRGGRVARGGIRWSDRREDYRTEVLGLMKAQMVKNAVIVPTGSKGGFVLRHTPLDRQRLLDEVRRQYVAFMRGLLDLTDNLVDGDVVHPEGVRVLDDDDPYLVVAADKGTAALSDTANEVAAEYGFWLGDAFASGGSAGYDHKKLGITARGAWESVKRHFREMGIDPMRDPITVVGVGDMSGDVFGNGMLYTDTLKLVAAFDHRHVFIDPSPDPATGFAERRRLFELAGSSWDDYDRSKISEGGGVWPRSAKSVELSPQAREALGVAADEGAGSLTPTDVIRTILKAPVDLLWNGGIGTYVKSSAETNVDVGDRTNDALRVNAKSLRCRVVGEGGNLGFTQRGRIEYAAAGGCINTDFIDNSGGVDCSDHEVNLKILLHLAIRRGGLTLERRNTLLEGAAGEVSEHVLYDNFLQAQILSQEEQLSPGRMEAYEDLMQSLEGVLDRELEALPPSEEMAERRRDGRGMYRPELAVLLAYAKRSLVNALLHSTLPDDAYFQSDLRRYFPESIVQSIGDLLPFHPLRRELIATIVANDVVNSQGITFVSRMVAETGAEPSEVARAHRVARDVTGAVERWEAIEALHDQVAAPVHDELMAGVDNLVETTARWYLAHEHGGDTAEIVEAAREPFTALSGVIIGVGSEAWRQQHEKTVHRLVGLGVDEQLARRHAYQAELVHGPDIIQVSGEARRSAEEVARAFFLLGEALHVDWLEQKLDELPAGSRWNRWAVQAMEDELLAVRRQLAQLALGEAAGRQVEAAVQTFLGARAEPLARLGRFMRALATEQASDIAALTVALRQVRSLTA